jgi:hypothetical protein
MIGQHGRLMVVLLHAPHLHAHSRVKIVLRAEGAQIALAQPVKFLRVAKPAIHAAFVPLQPNAINRVFAHVSLNQIFQRM